MGSCSGVVFSRISVIIVTFVIVLLSTAEIIEGKGRRNVLLTSGWDQYPGPPLPIQIEHQYQYQHQSNQNQNQPQQPPVISGLHPSHHFFFPRTENYYHRMKPDAVVEIVMDPSDELGATMVEHSSMTTSIHSQTEYRASCVKEPGCRWECEPRAEDLPPECDCVCYYTDAKWDNIP